MDTNHVLDAPIAAGRTAEIYPWKDDLALKLFRKGWGEAAVYYEAEKSRSVHAAGLPVPAMEGVVEVNGRFGILYERITGTPLIWLIQTKPWRLVWTARLLADLHLQIHSCQIPSLPSQKERLARHIRSIDGMPVEVQQTLLNILASQPEGQAVCHGDFHPENIILTHNGPVILDWMDATRGNPVADVARTSFLFRKAVLPPQMTARRLIELIRGMFHRIYLKTYFKGRNCDPAEWEAWSVLVAAARLAEDIPEEQEMLIDLVRSWFNGYSGNEGA
jgi:uncharacterized protein (TIGR02172 family)